MIQIALAELLNTVLPGTPLPDALTGTVTGITADSRQVSPGFIFVALPGTQVDGHDYVPKALAQGALCCLVKAGVPVKGDRLVAVEDPLAVMGRMARVVRARMTGRVMGITGSLGKTTAKEILAWLLAGRYRTEKAPESFNNDLGVPLTIFRATADTEMLVAELGANHPGEIRALSNILKPDVSVITTIAPVHLEGFGSIAGVVAAKSEIAEAMSPDGTLFLNAAMTGVDEASRRAPCRVRYFGDGTDTEWTVLSEEAHGVSFRLRDHGDFFLAGGGAQHLTSAAAAMAVAFHCGLDADLVRRRLQAFAMPNLRWCIQEAGGCRMILDCYNASPDSVRAAVLSAVSLARGGRVALVLGDMLELGADSERYHHALGGFIADQPVDTVYLVGREVVAVKQGLQEKSYQGSVAYGEEKDPFADAIARAAGRHDVILFKASRRCGLEALAKRVQATLAQEDSMQVTP